MSNKIYIAYGSNINLEQMAQRCPGSEVIAPGMLCGYELQFKYHATIEPKQDSEVPVLLWKLSEQDEKRLDVYEGFPKYYRKEILHFEFRGEEAECMVYIMNGNKPLQSPSPQYYSIIEQGYKSVGLDTKFLEQALAQAQKFDVGRDFQFRLG